MLPNSLTSATLIKLYREKNEGNICTVKVDLWVEKVLKTEKYLNSVYTEHFLTGAQAADKNQDRGRNEEKVTETKDQGSSGSGIRDQSHVPPTTSVAISACSKARME